MILPYNKIPENVGTHTENWYVLYVIVGVPNCNIQLWTKLLLQIKHSVQYLVFSYLYVFRPI